MPHLNQGFSYPNRIGANFEGFTVLAFYVQRYPLASPSEWEARIREGLVLLDDRPTTPETLLLRDQHLIYNRPQWLEQDAPHHWSVLFEDEHLVAINKPSGLQVLPGGLFLDNTLLSLVRQTYPDIAPIHRLGRGTSGIVICARSDLARSQLSKALRAGQFEKIYRTRVVGTDLPDHFEVHHPIGRIPYFEIDTLFAATPDGKASETHCVVVHRDTVTGQSLVRVHILTGRPHQIRIHLAAAGYPLVDDPLYTFGGGPRAIGPGERLPLPGDTGYHLHAHQITFPHPESGEEMTLTADLPDNLRTPEE
ncbi:MAG: RluA family pseudouridine synthase [bacterium]|jgi:23S rRNA pseudouridine1911/1915/1917 synthase|nr:RluA family pseudouridine synthase [bacterium]